jgi:hypothetical protein
VIARRTQTTPNAEEAEYLAAKPAGAEARNPTLSLAV